MVLMDGDIWIGVSGPVELNIGGYVIDVESPRTLPVVRVAAEAPSFQIGVAIHEWLEPSTQITEPPVGKGPTPAVHPVRPIDIDEGEPGEGPTTPMVVDRYVGTVDLTDAPIIRRLTQQGATVSLHFVTYDWE